MCYEENFVWLCENDLLVWCDMFVVDLCSVVVVVLVMWCVGWWVVYV